MKRLIAKTNIYLSATLGLVMVLGMFFTTAPLITPEVKAQGAEFCSVYPELADTRAHISVSYDSPSGPINQSADGVNGVNNNGGATTQYANELSNFHIDMTGNAGPGDAEGTVHSQIQVDGITVFDETVTGGNKVGPADYSSSYDVPTITATGYALWITVTAQACGNTTEILWYAYVTYSGTGTPSFDFSCGVNQSVTRGQNANFPVLASNLTNFSSDITVGTTIAPDNGLTDIADVQLNSGNSYLNNVIVPTANLDSTDPYTLTFTATGGGVTRTCQATLTVSPLIPVVNLKFNNSDGPTTPTPSNGSTGELEWVTQDATSCSASMTQGSYGSWSGAKNTANSGQETQALTGLQTNTTYQFRLTCTAQYGSTAYDEVIVNVGAPATPTADLQCQGDGDVSGVDGPCDVAFGGYALLYFSTTNLQSCTLSPTISGYSPGTSEVVGVSTGALFTTTIYTLLCTGPGGSVSDTVTINVPSGTRTVDIKCTGTDGIASDGPCTVVSGAKTNLTWTSEYCGPVSIDNGIGLVASNNTNPGLDVTISGDTTFIISCDPAFGEAPTIVDTVTVNIEVVGSPSIDIKCISNSKDTPNDGPCRVLSGETTKISWTSNLCDAISIQPNIGDVTYAKVPEMDVEVTETTEFSIRCDANVMGKPTSLKDSVFINVDTMACAPSPLMLTKGGAPGVITVDVSMTLPLINYYNINIVPSFDNGQPANPPTFSYSNNPQEGTPGQSSVIVSTSGNTTAGTHILTLSAVPEIKYPIDWASDPGGFQGTPQTLTCYVTLIISGVAPQDPTNVQAKAGQTCGTVEVTWDRPKSGPTPAHYEVYSLSYPTGGSLKSATQELVSGPIIDTGLGDGKFSFIHTEPFYSEFENYYSVRSYLDGLYSDYAAANPVIPTSCAPNIDLSDQDLTKVDNINGSSTACNDKSDVFVLPNQGVFRAGSKVYFSINVCNSGSKVLTGIRVELSGSNNLIDITPVIPEKNLCKIEDSGKGFITVGDIEGWTNQKEPIPVCYVNLEATIATPSASTGYLHRFWNQAIIYSNELNPKTVATPPYLYSTSATGVPSRGESAP